MSAAELCASIEVYQTQLKQIEDALSCAGAEERKQLQELQENLLQLLDLTLQQLNQQSSDVQSQPLVSDVGDRETEEPCSVESENKTIDDEFALFQSEIAELSRSDEDKKEPELSRSDEDKKEPKYSEEYLEGLEGTKCRAPFTEKWGGLSYHNAIVLSVERDENGKINLDDPKIRVLFTQPTSVEMLTCRFFLSGRCKFSDDACRFNHGQVIDVSDIQDYREPAYESIGPGSRVLVQQSEDLWTSATVEDVLEDRSAFCVKYDTSKKVAEVQLEQMVPLICEDAGDEEEVFDKDSDHASSIREGSTQEFDDQDDSEDETSIFIPTQNWLQHSLTQRLGDWEKYTKGIGSKLMQKMGYIVGTGLGPEGEGRVEPVVAYVYPQGVSLDRCMELREASNGEELLQVEKRLEREKKKEEAKSAQAAERLRKRTSVFDIINKKLGGKGADNDDDSDDEANQKPKMNVSRTVLQKDSMKNLNMKNYQLSENIRQLQREISKIEQSKERQNKDSAVVKIIDSKLQSKQMELERLLEAEKKVQGEQKNRKDSKKYCVF